MSTDLQWALGLFVAVVLTAAMVNRFEPTHRQRVRSVAILFLLYAVMLAAQLGFGAAGLPTWSQRAELGAELLRALTMVNLGATLTFNILLPAAGVRMPMIASDLLVGLGYVLAALGVLAGHGLNPTGAFASAAVVSAVLAISLQSTLGNILGGVALQLDGSVHEGDWIELADGKQGRVRAVRWRHTVLETRDWSTIVVPNSTLLASNIMLLGKRGGHPVPQRIQLSFNVDFRQPPNHVVDIVNAAFLACDIENVAMDPAPNCVCTDLTSKQQNGSYANYTLRYWVIDLAQVEPASSKVRARIYTALRRADIPLAVPEAQMRIQVDDEDRARQKRMSARLGALRSLELFRQLTDSELDRLVAGLNPAIYTRGEVITRQGSVAHWLYILSKGSVEVRATGERAGASGTRVALIEAPGVFGEMGLMTGEPRLADVIACTDVECYRLDKVTFEEVLSRRPELAEALSSELARRRVELLAIRDGLDEGAARDRVNSEQARILDSIKSFFGL